MRVYANVHVLFDVDGMWVLKMLTLLMVVVDANVEVSVRVRSKAAMTMLKSSGAEACKRGVAIGSGEGTSLHRPRPRSNRNRSEQVAVARMQHRAGAVERSEARQVRIVAPRVFGCVGSCIAVAVSILASCSSRHVLSETSRSFRFFF